MMQIHLRYLDQRILMAGEWADVAFLLLLSLIFRLWCHLLFPYVCIYYHSTP